MHGRVVAAVDASFKEQYMAAAWVITTLDNNERIEGSMYSSQWANGQVPVAEGLGVCNLIWEINAKCRNISRGEIVIDFDHKMIHKRCQNDIDKES